MGRYKANEILFQFGISVLYFITGWLGLQLAIPPGYSTVVFPAAGVAIAFALLRGPKVLPAIFVGSFAINALVSWKGQLEFDSILAGVIVATGATLQTFVGWWLLRQQAQNNKWQREPRTILIFLLCCGPLTSLVNASWSVGLLHLTGQFPVEMILRNWTFWWMGDSLGALVFGPLLLTLAEKPVLQWSHRKTILVIPPVVLFAMMSILYVLVSNHLNETIRVEFRHRVKNNAQLVASYLQRYEVALEGLQKSFESRPMSREEFRDYVEPIQNRLPGIQSINWVPKVPHADRDRVERQGRLNGHMKNGFLEAIGKDQKLVAAQKRNEYFPILYSVPAERSLDLMGFDMASTSSRQKIIQSSARQRMPVVSSPFDMIREHTKFGRKGFVWVFPVYTRDKKEFMGVISGVFRIQEIVLASLGETVFEEINFLMSDTSELPHQHLFTFSDSPEMKATTFDELKKVVNPAYISSNVVRFAGHTWMMDIFPSKKFSPPHNFTAVSIFIVGLFLVVLLQTLLILTASRTDLIEDLVTRKTAQIQSLLTEKTAAQSNLKEQRIFLETVLDNLPVALFCKDVDSGYRFSLWNKKAAHLFGFPQNVIVGKSDFDLFPKEQAEFFRQKDLETIQNKLAVEIPEEPLDTPQGPLILRTQKVPILDSSGQPKYLLGISEDITTQKTSEKTINEQKMMIIQAERMKALGEMAGGIAHEINNPLAIISQATVLIRALIKQPDSREKVDNTARLIESTTQRIGKIIKGLRMIARDAEGDPMESINVRQLLEDSLALCDSRFKAARIDLVVNEIDPSWHVFGRKAQLSQVLINLLNNAYDAVEKSNNPRVVVEVTRNLLMIEISVVDSGAGVPPELADKIMQPFFTTKEVGKGTGLGLSIAQGIIRTHQGTLKLDRTHAQTRFVIQLAHFDENQTRSVA